MGGEFDLLNLVASDNPPLFVGDTPSELDPRVPANQTALPTASLRADLEALRPAFDGLILYGYPEGNTPRTLELAKRLGYRAVLLGVWEMKSAAELDGVATLCDLYKEDLHKEELALGVIVGNEGLPFGR